jgi:hypothetical protein
VSGGEADKIQRLIQQLRIPLVDLELNGLAIEIRWNELPVIT